MQWLLKDSFMQWLLKDPLQQPLHVDGSLDLYRNLKETVSALLG